MLKALIGNPVFQFVAGRLIGGYLLFVGMTTRWTKVNRAAAEPFWAPGGGRVIGCFWHGRFALVREMWSFKPTAAKAKMLISNSREGGIVAHTALTVGTGVIRGSEAKKGNTKSKRGAEAMREMARHIEAGGTIAMTPDGPRGPRMRVRRGPVTLAKISGAPMLAMAWSTSNQIVFGESWDRFMLPLPFGKGALVWGNPIAAPSADASEEEMERVRLALEVELNRISAEADRIAGAAPIEPAPPRVELTMAAAEPAASTT